MKPNVDLLYLLINVRHARIDPATLIRDFASKSDRRKPAPPFKTQPTPQVQRGRPVQFPWIPKADTKKKYKCEVCGKQFAQQQHYLGHTNVHFGRRPFKCKICSVGFPYQSQLAAHRKSCKEPGESSLATNTSTCKICSKSFTEHFKLVRHMVQVHHSQNLMSFKEFVCACGAKFDWHAAYKSHCSSCPKSSPLDKS
ncbi:zinc finger protein 112-like [Ylistrum balloti]|uniref:zinc finger protein 112-like n=1 Tax=Ylistrum balloti TaxID=509963 RepID=UPI002905A1B2|nr:zinc finger protein 112-like [Ylistrum balloti]